MRRLRQRRGAQKQQIEDHLWAFLGATRVVWLPFGHRLDTGPAGTDGHVDGVLQYAAPGQVMLEVVSDPASPEYARGQANLECLRGARDARGPSTIGHRSRRS